MGLPQINIKFQTLAVTAIARSARGIVALILKDSTTETFDTKIYTDVTQIDALDWSADSLDYLNKTFLGTPTKVIVEREAADAINYYIAAKSNHSPAINNLPLLSFGSYN